jgi:hypothetical protein
LSILSAGCLFWLDRLQPLFVVLAMSALAYQGSLIWRRPRARRTRTLLAIFWSSVAINAFVFTAWLWLWLRYR